MRENNKNNKNANKELPVGMGMGILAILRQGFGPLVREAIEAEITIFLGRRHYEHSDEFKGYRALFDVKPAQDSIEPIDVRLYLRIDGRPLTETWIYQWTPPALQDRKAALG